MKQNVNVQDATHVKINGEYVRIASKYGIDEHGHLAKPSEGGFGMRTEDGRTINMWEAEAYGQEE